jgi:hypothetical protein
LSNIQTGAAVANGLRPIVSLAGGYGGALLLGPAIAVILETAGAQGLITLRIFLARYGPIVTLDVMKVLNDPSFYSDIASGDYVGALANFIPLEEATEIAQFIKNNPAVDGLFQKIAKLNFDKFVTNKVDSLKNYLGESEFLDRFGKLTSDKLADLLGKNSKLTAKELDLAFDPAQGKINLDELNNALSAEKKLGIELKRNPIEYVNGNPKKGADFIDPKTGKTYDDFGTGPIESKFLEQFNDGTWKTKFLDHIDKSDITLLDLSKLSVESKNKVLDYLQTLPKEILEKIEIL